MWAESWVFQAEYFRPGICTGQDRLWIYMSAAHRLSTGLDLSCGLWGRWLFVMEAALMILISMHFYTRRSRLQLLELKRSMHMYGTFYFVLFPTLWWAAGLELAACFRVCKREQILVLGPQMLECTFFKSTINFGVLVTRVHGWDLKGLTTSS